MKCTVRNVRIRLCIGCWNVGWGEATVMGVPLTGEAVVVDFGTSVHTFGSLSVRYACSRARSFVKGYGSIVCYITHLHYDHYSLLPFVLGGARIDELLLPGIPGPREVAEKVLFLLASEVAVLRLSGSAVLGKLAKGVRSTSVVYRGMVVDHGYGVKARILWPPLTLPPSIAEHVKAKLAPVYERAKELIKKADLERHVKEYVKELSTLYVPEPSSEEPIRVEVPEALPTYALKEGIGYPTKQRGLVAFLHRVGEAINDMSLIIKFYLGDCSWGLVPGDNSDMILDYLAEIETGDFRLNPLEKHLLFLRGAHHGTYYGEFIGMHRARVAWLSWTRCLPAPPRGEYMGVAGACLLAENIDEVRVYGRSCWLAPGAGLHVELIERWI